MALDAKVSVVEITGAPQFQVRFRVSGASQQQIGASNKAAEGTAGTGSTMTDWTGGTQLTDDNVVNTPEANTSEGNIPEGGEASAPAVAEQDMSDSLDQDIPLDTDVPLESEAS